jgi:hypothetical protein
MNPMIFHLDENAWRCAWNNSRKDMAAQIENINGSRKTTL